jgi:hypothetical protein
MNHLTKSEARFIKEWEFQTSGSRKTFLVLNSAIFIIMIYFFSSATSYVAAELRIKHFDYFLGLAATVLLGLLSAFLIYYVNQTRYLRIKLKLKQEAENN